MLSHLKKMDWPLVTAAVLLVIFGLISIYGSGGEGLLNFKKQILWLTIGFFLMIAVSFFDYRVFKNYRIPVISIYAFSLFLLLGVLIFGVEIRGAESWYRIGSITLEPVEFAKMILILLLAKYFSMRHIEMYRVRHVIISGIYVFLPASLVFIQPDSGSVMILLSIWIGVMIIAGIKLKHIIALALIGVVMLSAAWIFAFQDYQKDRILSFINPELDPRGSGYNSLQSVIAIGSGGIWGQGIGEGTQTQLGFLPEAHTDFIYAAIVEEMGLIGGLMLLAVFIFFIRRVMYISKNSENNFARLVAAGFSVMIISQVLINTGMNIGILPITGIPLPFVSYGGSSLISLFLMLGVLQSIRVNS